MTIDELKFLTVGDVIDSPLGPGVVTSHRPVYYQPLIPDASGINRGTQIEGTIHVTIISLNLEYVFVWWTGADRIEAVTYPVNLINCGQDLRGLNLGLNLEDCSILHKAGTRVNE